MNEVIEWLENTREQAERLIVEGEHMKSPDLSKGAKLAAIRYLRRSLQKLADEVKQ